MNQETTPISVDDIRRWKQERFGTDKPRSLVKKLRKSEKRLQIQAPKQGAPLQRPPAPTGTRIEVPYQGKEREESRKKFRSR